MFSGGKWGRGPPILVKIIFNRPEKGVRGLSPPKYLVPRLKLIANLPQIPLNRCESPQIALANRRKMPQNAAKCHKTPQNAAKRRKTPQNTAKRRKTPQNAAKCRKMPQTPPPQLMAKSPCHKKGFPSMHHVTFEIVIGPSVHRSIMLVD